MDMIFPLYLHVEPSLGLLKSGFDFSPKLYTTSSALIPLTTSMPPRGDTERRFLSVPCYFHIVSARDMIKMPPQSIKSAMISKAHYELGHLFWGGSSDKLTEEVLDAVDTAVWWSKVGDNTAKWIIWQLGKLHFCSDCGRHAHFHSPEPVHLRPPCHRRLTPIFEESLEKMPQDGIKTSVSGVLIASRS
ncbi:hypothetical protein BDZ45DRAFT_390869 [Acephala macrosclerotiorum]|nr:hypothetical protein BDZ45DRAFT_390869 [Acephala macrosclerotiorum]